VVSADPVVRPHAASSQDLLRRCADLGIAAVRRPTGGKAILHHREVTFSIISPAAGLGSVIESYRTFARAIATGLHQLGLEAQLCEPQAAPRRGGLLCFAAPAQCDLEVGGRKLLGSAQARHRGALLQQNSLPLVLSDELKRRLFGGPSRWGRSARRNRSHRRSRPRTIVQRREGRDRQWLRIGVGNRFQPSVPSEKEFVAAKALGPSFAL